MPTTYDWDRLCREHYSTLHDWVVNKEKKVLAALRAAGCKRPPEGKWKLYWHLKESVEDGFFKNGVVDDVVEPFPKKWPGQSRSKAAEKWLAWVAEVEPTGVIQFMDEERILFGSTAEPASLATRLDEITSRLAAIELLLKVAIGAIK